MREHSPNADMASCKSSLQQWFATSRIITVKFYLDSSQQIKTAREFAEVMPNTEAAKELLEFLDSEEVKEAIVRGASE